MSIKFKTNFDINFSDLTDGLDAKLKAAAATTARVTGEKAQNLAGQKLRAGLKWWEKGFNIEKAGDGTWVLSISGKMANMMEDGFGPGAVSDMILNGNRAKVNAAEGKDYVDVPIHKEVNVQTGEIQGTKVRVQQFTNIQELQKQFTFSDFKKGGVKQEQRLVKRVDDIIQSRKKDDASAQFLTIRRLSKNSKPWPQHPFPGAKVLDALDHEIETAFGTALQKLL